MALENSTAVARENSTVEAWGNSTVKAWENSTAVARENSTVEAWGNSTVKAWGNSTINSQGNAQIVDYLFGGKIEITGNARVVHNPKTIVEYLDFYGIKHTKTKCSLYKAVRKNKDGILISDRNENFVYEIGKVARCEKPLNINTDDDCGSGIHLAHMYWCLDYGRDWDNLCIIECEADIKNIVVPLSGCGKVRVDKVKVIREVPLEECGIYGRILKRRMEQNNE